MTNKAILYGFSGTLKMADQGDYPLLNRVDSPEDLRPFSTLELEALARETRGFMIETVSKTGGHLAANLGVVELTIALHHVFNTPYDRLVWDVGHQTYPHKILTGRRQRMATLRQKDGLAGFPKRSESEYDTFDVGHSSTSISAAVGMAMASKAQGTKRKVVAIIGDGAMGAGMAFEALNQAGDHKCDLLVILNDNDMSISPNVGALSNYLTRALSGHFYSTVREGGKRVLSHMPGMMEVARRAEEHVKGLVTPGTLFEEMGFNYYGPIDGHDMEALISTLRNLRSLTGPRLLHVVTRKGKGYHPAEHNPSRYHGVGKFDPRTGDLPKSAATPTYTAVFSQWLCAMGAHDSRLHAITPAMGEGSGLVEFAQRFPDRHTDVGIAEQHAVTMAAGLACEGLRPVVAIYSTFFQRAYDQLIHDVALMNLPVTFAIDRGGLVGPDGPTHAGAFDLSFLRCIPNIVVMAPADEEECWRMLSTAHLLDQPAAVRYPRGCGPGAELTKTLEPLPVGKAQTLRHGKNIAILAFGSMVTVGLDVADRLDATLINMRFVKPLDHEAIDVVARDYDVLITIEENAIMGGAGSGINEYLLKSARAPHILNLGLPDRFIDQGSRDELLIDCGLDADSLTNTIREFAQRVTAFD